MYSESDIDQAVAAGALTPDAATALRNHVAATRAAPAVDEEHFRLLTGFNDIFVSIAIVLLLAAVAQIGGTMANSLGGAAVAGTAWLLAEYFTRTRRMALPSIVLLLAFVGGVAATMTMGVLAGVEAVAGTAPGTPGFAEDDTSKRVLAGLGAVAAALTAGAAWLHWRRFAVPITVAAGVCAAVATFFAIILTLVPELGTAAWALLLFAGIIVFALAMRWDMSDRERRTRRSDVAFWLHLAAAPMIAHALFNLLGVFGGEMTGGRALLVLALYVAFAAVALAVDRRALLVSSLAYVLYALYSLIRDAGASELGWAFTALVIGSALLSLSAFWHPMRTLVVTRLGRWQDRLPPVQTVVPA